MELKLEAFKDRTEEQFAPVPCKQAMTDLAWTEARLLVFEQVAGGTTRLNNNRGMVPVSNQLLAQKAESFGIIPVV